MDTGRPLSLADQAAAPLSMVTGPARAGLRIERLDNGGTILAAVRELKGGAETGFQSAAWLEAVYRHLVPAIGLPLGIAIRCSGTNRLLGLMALYTYKHGRITVAKFADCGVSDYNAILTRDAESAERLRDCDLLALIKPACRPADVLALERMNASGPLSDHPAVTPSQMSGNTLTIATGVDDYIRGRGKKYRKEAERSFRVLESHGAWSFQRAETREDVATAFAELERQQAERHADKAGHYALSAPHYGAFYRDLLLNHPGSAHIFTLKVEGVIIAALMGITHGNTFTLLRTANGGEAWRQVSPGRLIVIEAMRYFVPRGVTVFDMGIGDYAFKRGFGTDPIALADLVVPMSWRGAPSVAARRLKERLRESESLRAAVRAVKARLRALRR